MSSDDEIKQQVEAFIRAMKEGIPSEEETSDGAINNYVVSIMGTSIETLSIEATSPKEAAEKAYNDAFSGSGNVLDTKQNIEILTIFDLTGAAEELNEGTLKITTGKMRSDGSIRPTSNSKKSNRARNIKDMPDEEKERYEDKIAQRVQEHRELTIDENGIPITNETEEEFF